MKTKTKKVVRRTTKSRLPKISDEERLNLFHAWLEGDNGAGDRLWNQSGFLIECIKLGKISARKRLNEIGSAANRLNIKEDLSREDLSGGGTIAGWVYEIIDEARSGKDRSDFPTLQSFRNNISLIVARRIGSWVEKELGSKKGLHLLSRDAGDEGGENSWGTIDSSVGETSLSEPSEASSEVAKAAIKLLRAFHRGLVSEPNPATSQASTLTAASHFFSGGSAPTILELKDGKTAERIIRKYLSTKGGHIKKKTSDKGKKVRLYDYMRDLGVSSPAADTRRLRKNWRKFCDGKGADLWRAYNRSLWESRTEYRWKSPGEHEDDQRSYFRRHDISVPERPYWERIDFGLKDFDRLIKDLLEQVQVLRNEGGGVLIVPHSSEQEPSIGLLLRLFTYRLRKTQNSWSVRFVIAHLADDVEETLSPDVVIISHMPRLPGLLPYLESTGLAGKVIVGAGHKNEWKDTEIPVHHYVLGNLPRDASLDEWRHTLLKEEIKAYVALPVTSQRIYKTAVVWDAHGVPLPLDLLARTQDLKEKETRTAVNALAENGLIRWCDQWAFERRRVATKSPIIAREMLDELTKLDYEEEESAEEDGYEEDVRLDTIFMTLKAIDATQRAERHLLLQLFQSALPEIRRRREAALTFTPHDGQGWANSVIRGRMWEQIEPILEEMTAIEAVSWSRVLARLRIFDKAVKVLDRAFGRHGASVHLLHARAQLLADQVQINASLASEAREAFAAAANEQPGNCYIQQSWAMMLAKTGADPTPRFRQALKVAKTAGERTAVRAAWADYETERGNSEAVERLLKAVEGDAPGNAYVPHLRGKAAFLRGDYKTAKRHFRAVIDRDLYSVAAYNALGHMARVRGDTRAAHKYIEKALALDPENVPTLHERGNLQADIADDDRANATRQPGERDAFAIEVAQAYHDAYAHHEHARKLEPENVRVLVSAANALLPLAARDDEWERDRLTYRLDRALELSPGNARARHVYGRFHQEMARHAPESDRIEEQRKRAKAYYDAILGDDDQNLPALCSLADLHVDAENEEAARSTLNVLARVLRRSARPVHERIRALNAWAEIEHRLGNTAQAIERAEAASELDPDNGYTRRLLKRLQAAQESVR